MELDLTSRAALVTGASRGLAREVAVALGAHGAEIVVCARDPSELAETCRLVEDASGRPALALAADISRAEDVEALRAQAHGRFGTVSILVNAAGTFGPIALVANSDPADWIQTVMTNTIGPYLTSRAFVAGMVEQGWGRIVNVSSAAPLYPPGPLNSAYSTSKAALNHFTRHLAAELEGTGVTANVLHPGSLKTAMWNDIREKVEREPAAEGLRDWVALVDSTGGDSMELAVRLVLSLVDPASKVSGTFAWPESMVVSDPLPSW